MNTFLNRPTATTMSFLSDRNPYLVAGGALAAGIAIGVFGKKV